MFEICLKFSLEEKNKHLASSEQARNRIFLRKIFLSGIFVDKIFCAQCFVEIKEEFTYGFPIVHVDPHFEGYGETADSPLSNFSSIIVLIYFARVIYLGNRGGCDDVEDHATQSEA